MINKKIYEILENRKLKTTLENINSENQFTTAMLESQMDKLLEKKLQALKGTAKIPFPFAMLFILFCFLQSPKLNICCAASQGAMLRREKAPE